MIWEHGFIRRELYQKQKINDRFIPVGFGPFKDAHVPTDLQEYTYFDLDSEADYKKLLSVLLGKPLVVPHPIGGGPIVAAIAPAPIASDTSAPVGKDKPQDANASAAHDPLEKTPRGQSSTVFFSDRFSQAFPGVRGVQWFQQAEAVERLALLLRLPLTFRAKQSSYEPIWFWGRGSLGIEYFSSDGTNAVLLDVLELNIDAIAAVNARGYAHKFVYVQTSPSEPTGLYDHRNIEEETRRFGFVSEEFGLYNGRAVTRNEYDDGAAVLDGKPVDIHETVRLRVRYLTPYNFLIAAHNSPINDDRFDHYSDELLNEMLRGEKSIDDLTNAVLSLPKRPPMSYEF